MQKIIESAIRDLNCCNPNELLDYVTSSFAMKRKQYINEELDIRKIRYVINKIHDEKTDIYEFECSSGYLK